MATAGVPATEKRIATATIRTSAASCGSTSIFTPRRAKAGRQPPDRMDGPGSPLARIACKVPPSPPCRPVTRQVTSQRVPSRCSVVRRSVGAIHAHGASPHMEQHAGHAVTPASECEWVACRHACVSRRAGTLPLAGERANPRHCRLKPCQVQTRAFRPLGRTRECDVPCPCFLQWGQRTAIIVISPGNEDQEQDRAGDHLIHKAESTQPGQRKS